MGRFFTSFRMTILAKFRMTILAKFRSAFWTFLPMLAALAGCDPEPIPVSAEVESGGQEVVTFDFSVMGYDGCATKASASDVEDGLVDRIDIFMYDKDGWVYGHEVIGEYGGGPLDLSKVKYEDHEEKGTMRYFLVMANLDPDSARYISYLDKIDLARYPEGFIPWSAGNARVNYPLMGATAWVNFGGSGTSQSISLMRYMAKFEIGTISATFWGDPDLYRNVYVQHIAFVNAWDIIRICQTKPGYFYGSPTDIFGPRSNGYDAFGNYVPRYYMANCFLDQNEWSAHDMKYSDMHGTYNQGTWGGKGKLKKDCHYLYNDNFQQPKHTINLDCPDELKELSQHTWDTNAYLPQVAGKLCSDIDGYLGPLNVNRAFYTLPTKYNVWFDEPLYGDGESDQQNIELRLVLAVKINGRLYFYSKMLRGIDPNTCYKIKNITLKGEPSEYANCWIRGGQVTKSGAEGYSEAFLCHSEASAEETVCVRHGNVVEIENLVL